MHRLLVNYDKLAAEPQGKEGDVDQKCARIPQ